MQQGNHIRIFEKSSGVFFTALVLLYVINFASNAQVGGKKSFEFLNIPQNARLTGLGGVNISLSDRDVNLFYSNPTLSGDTLAGIASANYQFYVADIGHAAFTYAHDFKTIGMISMGVQHANYGSFQGYDATGFETTTLSAGETALYIGKSHQIGMFRMGANVKGIFSNLAGYRANALAMDIGGLFIHPEKLYTVGLAIKNIGFVLSDYLPGTNNRLPIDLQLGMTIKPVHMPVRFSLTAFQLVASDVTYDDPSDDGDNSNIVKRVLSHVNVGAEILLHKNVNILAGYNFLNHQALKLNEGGGGAGLSIGFSANIKSFEFVFSRGSYVAGNAGYSFTLSKNIDKLLKRS